MLTNQKSLFSLPEHVTYLNCAYMSPLMKEVEAVGVEALKKKGNPAAISVSDFFEDTDRLRASFSKLINTPEPNRIVVIPSVSYGIANVIRNVRLEKGDNVVIINEQFPSNYYSWHRLCTDSGAELKVVSAKGRNEERGKSWNEKILHSIDRRTKLVALGHVHWADGTLFDLEEIRKRTKEIEALMIIDGTQSVGALPFDIQTLQPDALICAGYKWLMGPYSIGLAYYGPFFDDGIPIEENWINRLHSEDFAGLVNYQTEYQPGALRYEVGEHSNFNLVPMLLKAVEKLNEWGPAQIQKYCDQITKEALDTLSQEGFSIECADYRGAHLFGIRLPHSIPIDLLKSKLSQANINVSVRGDAVRVSPHVYNTKEDMARLAEVLVQVK